MAGVLTAMLVICAVGAGSAEAGVLSVVKKPCPWDPYHCDTVGLEFSDPAGERNIVTVRFTDNAVVVHDRNAPIRIEQPDDLSWYWPIAEPYHGCTQINEQAVTCASLPSAGICPGCQYGVASGWERVSLDLGAGNDLLYADDKAPERIECGAGHDSVRYDAVDRRTNCEGHL